MELFRLVNMAADTFILPPVKQVFIPEPQQGPDRHTEFGLLELEDGAAGVYYAWLGDSQQGMNSRYADISFRGMPVLELMQYFMSDHEADCSLGMAAVNAITQSVFRQSGFHPGSAGDSMAQLNIEPGDHIGMVGYFPSLVRRLCEQGIELCVIEKKTQFVQSDELLQVTLDPAKLKACNKIIATASTLLNNSIDDILKYTSSAEVVVFIGPTAGFFPDVLFKCNVSAIGGSEIIDAAGVVESIRQKKGLGEFARKYVIVNSDYPGLDKLILK